MLKNPGRAASPGFCLLAYSGRAPNYKGTCLGCNPFRADIFYLESGGR